ncbi:MAG: hypothetical protein HN878_02765, partial [Candidatus Diapherotrites archaeon]|nr:hypothetical protein [Candidatus Diapherotrites archaeon]
KDEEDLVTTMLWQKQIMGDIKSGKLKPKHFKYVPFKAKILKGEYFGIQEYFHKPNAEQLLSYLKAVKEKRLATRHNEYLTKDEYELCKKFMKNPVNSRINIQKIESTVNELLNYMGGSGNWQEMHHHNILIQGINRDGTLRITLIDV